MLVSAIPGDARLGAVTGRAGYHMGLPLGTESKPAPLRAYGAHGANRWVVTGNSDFAAVSGELPRHCRQHRLPARKDPGRRSKSTRTRLA